MLRSLAKIAAKLEIDNVANRFVESLYSNGRGDRRFSRRFQVLTYHKVSPEDHPLFPPVDPKQFEEQIGFLKRCYNVLPLQELVDRSMQGDIPARAVAITFDDGYADNYEYAFPILKKYNAPATIFVATGIVGTGNVLWHDRMFDAFRYATRKRAKLSNIDLPEVSLETPEAQRKSIWQIRLKARKMYGDALQGFMDDLERALKPTCTAREKQRMLTWDQIQTMNRCGIDFGSHSVTHPILSELPRAVLTKELNESKRELSDRLQTDVVAFAYPNGQPADYSREVQTALKEIGYQYAVTTSRGVNGVFADAFALKRCSPWQTDIDLFRVSFFCERHGLSA